MRTAVEGPATPFTPASRSTLSATRRRSGRPPIDQPQLLTQSTTGRAWLQPGHTTLINKSRRGLKSALISFPTAPVFRRHPEQREGPPYLPLLLPLLFFLSFPPGICFSPLPLFYRIRSGLVALGFSPESRGQSKLPINKSRRGLKSAPSELSAKYGAILIPRHGKICHPLTRTIVWGRGVWLEGVKAHCRDSRYHYMQDNPAYSVRYYVEEHGTKLRQCGAAG
jgi:hypothetical protein